MDGSIIVVIQTTCNTMTVLFICDLGRITSYIAGIYLPWDEYNKLKNKDDPGKELPDGGENEIEKPEGTSKFCVL